MTRVSTGNSARTIRIVIRTVYCLSIILNLKPVAGNPFSEIYYKVIGWEKSPIVAKQDEQFVTIVYDQIREFSQLHVYDSSRILYNAKNSKSGYRCFACTITGDGAISWFRREGNDVYTFFVWKDDKIITVPFVTEGGVISYACISPSKRYLAYVLIDEGIATLKILDTRADNREILSGRHIHSGNRRFAPLSGPFVGYPDVICWDDNSDKIYFSTPDGNCKALAVPGMEEESSGLGYCPKATPSTGTVLVVNRTEHIGLMDVHSGQTKPLPIPDKYYNKQILNVWLLTDPNVFVFETHYGEGTSSLWSGCMTEERITSHGVYPSYGDVTAIGRKGD